MRLTFQCDVGLFRIRTLRLLGVARHVDDCTDAARCCVGELLGERFSFLQVTLLTSLTSLMIVRYAFWATGSTCSSEDDTPDVTEFIGRF
jgi:hypothetical protein